MSKMSVTVWVWTCDLCGREEKPTSAVHQLPSHWTTVVGKANCEGLIEKHLCGTCTASVFLSRNRPPATIYVVVGESGAFCLAYASEQDALNNLYGRNLVKCEVIPKGGI